MKVGKFNVPQALRIFLADNDEENCLFYTGLSAQLKSIQDDEQLILLLKFFSPSKQEKNTPLPHILFLDLNMHRKSGFECVTEIRSINEPKDFSIVIMPSLLDTFTIDLLFDSAAHYYIQKPNDFSLLKNIFLQAINKKCSENLKKTTRDTFILQPYN